MAELVSDHMLDTPLGEQQGVDRETDDMSLNVAHAPTGYHGLVGDGGWGDTHLLGITFDHGLDDSIKAGDGLGTLLAGFKWQLTVEGGALLLALEGALTGLHNPVEMLGNELLDGLFGQSDRCRNMHIAIFGDAHG